MFWVIFNEEQGKSKSSVYSWLDLYRWQDKNNKTLALVKEAIHPPEYRNHQRHELNLTAREKMKYQTLWNAILLLEMSTPNGAQVVETVND